MRIQELVGTALILTFLCVGSAEGQRAGATVVGEAGLQSSDRHEAVAHVVGVKAAYTTGGAIDHYFGLRAAVVLGMDLDCALGPDGGCLNSLHEPALLTLFYEPRLTLRPAGDTFRPYLGTRISAARGWDGLGGGVGLSYGVQVLGPGGGVIDLGGVTEGFVVGPAGTAGNGRNHAATGIQLGVGWRF